MWAIIRPLGYIRTWKQTETLSTQSFRWDIPIVLYRITKYRQNTVKQNLFNIYITKMFLHNLSRHISALSWAIFRLNTFLCEASHTINNIMLLLSMRSRVTSIQFIQLKLITVIVELKCCYNIKDIKEHSVIITEGGWGCQNRGIFLFKYVGFFIGYSVVA
jgi:hypothetical protein